MQLLREYTQNDLLIREYTKDGVTVSHKVETPVKNETSGEVIELPKNPIIDLQERVDLMQQALDEMLLGGTL